MKQVRFLDYLPALSEQVEDVFALPLLNALRNEAYKSLDFTYYFIVYKMHDTGATNYILSDNESNLIWVASKKCDAQFFKLKVEDNKLEVIDLS